MARAEVLHVRPPVSDETVSMTGLFFASSTFLLPFTPAPSSCPAVNSRCVHSSSSSLRGTQKEQAMALNTLGRLIQFLDWRRPSFRRTRTLTYTVGYNRRRYVVAFGWFPLLDSFFVCFLLPAAIHFLSLSLSVCPSLRVFISISSPLGVNLSVAASDFSDQAPLVSLLFSSLASLSRALLLSQRRFGSERFLLRRYQRLPSSFRFFFFCFHLAVIDSLNVERARRGEGVGNEA